MILFTAINTKNLEKKESIFNKKPFSVGSSDLSNFVMTDSQLAEKHFLVFTKNSEVYIKCFLKKTVLFDGRQVSEFGPLEVGFVFFVGNISFKLEQAENKNEKIEHDHISLMSLKKEVHKKVIELLDLRRVDIKKFSDCELKKHTRTVVLDAMHFFSFPIKFEENKFIDEIIDEAVGLGPLESLLRRNDVSEIMVNAKDEIFYEHEGRLLKSDVVFSSDEAVIAAIERIVAPIGRRIDESSPMVDARLKDGSRVNAIIPPLSIKGPCLTIRKFSNEKLTADHLIKYGSLNSAMKTVLNMAVKYKQNLIVSGGTGSGKTTLLNVLSNFIPDNERIITVEDAAELKLNQKNLVSLETKPSNADGSPGVDIRQLVKNCLRMRPDRIVVGECRGGEAVDMLQAMNTGHDGSLTTIHSNSPRDCISRLEVLVLMSGIDFPIRAIREQIASAVNIIVQQTRFSCGSRKITSIAEITGIENDTVQISEIFKFNQEGFDRNGKILGSFYFTGVVPEFYGRLRKAGVSIDFSLFEM